MLSFSVILRPKTSLSIIGRYCIVSSSIALLLLILKLVLHSLFAQENLAVIIPLLVFYLGQAFILRKE